MKDHYKILGLSPRARPEQIRQKYRLLVQTCHPDKFSDPVQKAEAEERLKEINEAYGVLGDPVKRARYNRQRAAHAGWRPTPQPAPQPGPQPAPRPTSRSFRSTGWHPSPPPVVPVERQYSSSFIGPGAIDHLHYTFYAGRGDQVEVELDRRANVLLLDEINYARYRSGVAFRCLGGYALVSPVVLPVLYTGPWHLVIDLGGYPGMVRAAARLVHRGGWW